MHGMLAITRLFYHFQVEAGSLIYLEGKTPIGLYLLKLGRELRCLLLSKFQNCSGYVVTLSKKYQPEGIHALIAALN